MSDYEDVKLYYPFGWQQTNPCPMCDAPYPKDAKRRLADFEYGGSAERLVFECGVCNGRIHTHTKRLSPDPGRARRVAAALEMRSENL